MPPPEQTGAHSASANFRILGSEVVYKGPRIDVDRTTIMSPAGETFEREVVRHPGAVAVVPVTDSGSVLLVRQFRAPTGRRLIEIPAGTRDVDGEPPEETARRELTEEVGVVAGKLVELGRYWNSPGFCDEETILYIATDLTPGETDRGGVEEEYIEVLEIPLEEVDGALAADATLDMQTVVGVILARSFLAQQRATQAG